MGCPQRPDPHHRRQARPPPDRRRPRSSLRVLPLTPELSQSLLAHRVGAIISAFGLEARERGAPNPPQLCLIRNGLAKIVRTGFPPPLVMCSEPSITLRLG